VIELEAEPHDRAAALASHLPYVVAQALVHRIADREDAKSLAAAGWRRATQGAHMDPVMWRDILLTNGGPIAAELEALRDSLDGVARALRGGNDPLPWLESGANSAV
jgi:prephenate dehydrogenase